MKIWESTDCISSKKWCNKKRIIRIRAKKIKKKTKFRTVCVKSSLSKMCTCVILKTRKLLSKKIRGFGDSHDLNSTDKNKNFRIGLSMAGKLRRLRVSEMYVTRGNCFFFFFLIFLNPPWVRVVRLLRFWI